MDARTFQDEPLDVRVIWRCECGKTLTTGLPQCRCPYCMCAYMTTHDGRVVVTAGSWEVVNL